MIGVLKSSVIGAAAFVVEVLVACLLLVVVATANGAWDPESHAVRQTMALLGLALVTGASLVALGKIPFALASRFGANAWVALAVAGALTGLAVHPVLFYVSFMNDCTLDVRVPYNVSICSDG